MAYYWLHVRTGSLPLPYNPHTNRKDDNWALGAKEGKKGSKYYVTIGSAALYHESEFDAIVPLKETKPYYAVSDPS